MLKPMPKPNVYLDYAAASPLDRRVISVMEPYFSDLFYNPSADVKPCPTNRRGGETDPSLKNPLQLRPRILGPKHLCPPEVHQCHPTLPAPEIPQAWILHRPLKKDLKCLNGRAATTAVPSIDSPSVQQASHSRRGLLLNIQGFLNLFRNLWNRLLASLHQ